MGLLPIQTVSPAEKETYRKLFNCFTPYVPANLPLPYDFSSTNLFVRYLSTYIINHFGTFHPPNNPWLPEPRQIQIIISMTSFHVQEKSQIKELAYLNLRSKHATLYNIQVPRYDSLSCFDKQNAKFLTEHIHGLPYSNNEYDLHKSNLNLILSHFVNLCKENNTYIAFKGNIFEKKLLHNFPTKFIIDLDRFGTPKYNHFLGRAPYISYINYLTDNFPHADRQHCLHLPLKNNQLGYCALTRVKYLGAWLLRHFGPFPSST